MTEMVRTCSLQEVASWQIPGLSKTFEARLRLTGFCPGIPSLQRGAVWKPKQIELLWDSLMRGFPVGSFIVCAHSESDRQILRSGVHACMAELGPPAFTHQLLDGQQRANAITLGFLDPCVNESASLWLDLLAEPKEDRRFLFRVTTRAHPWGYEKEFNKLSASTMRDAMELSGAKDLEDASGIKPKYTFWPVQADLPVPVAWLLDPALNLTAEGSSAKVLEMLRTKALETSPTFYARFLQRLERATLSDEQWNRITHGLSRLLSARLIALEVAGDVLKDADGEDSEEQSSNVEHLFTRLNSGGTTLDGSELAYSLIKAYWPEIEAKIAALPRVDSEARLSSLAFRDALSTAPTQDGFQRSLTISQMRRIATEKGSEEQMQENARRRRLIRTHLGLDSSNDPFRTDLVVLKNFLDWSLQESSGLHPFLRNDLLASNPELVLVLLHLVRRFHPSPSSESHRRRILGLATAMHWFAGGTESDRRFAADQAVKHLGNDADWGQFHGILGKCHLEGKGMLRLVAPEVLEGLIPPFNASLVDFLNARSDHLWTFWRELSINQHQGDTPKDWPFVERLKSLRRLLVYSQRAFMGTQFADFDTVDVGAWDDHNRPWDYDHVLPAATLYYKQVAYKKTADEWLNTIGNLRAWPLSENRSRQDDTPEKTITGQAVAQSNMTEAEVKAFSRKTEDFAQLEPTLGFLNAARARMMRMYRDWYETLEIGVLVGEAKS